MELPQNRQMKALQWLALQLQFTAYTQHSHRKYGQRIFFLVTLLTNYNSSL